MLLNWQLWSIHEKYINDIHILWWSKRATVGFATMGLIQFTSDIPSGSFSRSYEVISKSWKIASRTSVRSPSWHAWHEFEMFWIWNVLHLFSCWLGLLKETESVGFLKERIDLVEMLLFMLQSVLYHFNLHSAMNEFKSVFGSLITLFT